LSERRVGTGLIGGGGIGELHLKNLLEIPQAQVVAVADVNPEVKRAADACGARFYQDYGEMLEREALELAVISTPSHLHRDPVLAAAENGASIYLEKPVATSIEDLRAITRAVEERGVKATVGHQNRCDPRFSALRGMAMSGVFGRVFKVRAESSTGWGFNVTPQAWRWRRALGGGPWWQNGGHIADLASWVLGEPLEVAAFSGTYVLKTEAEDNLVAVVKYRDALAELATCYCLGVQKPVGLEVYGDKGYGAADPLLGFRAWLNIGVVKGAYEPEVAEVQPHRRLMELTVDALLNEKAMPIPLGAGVKACEVVLAGHESAATGRAVKLPLL